jgi:sulfate transport system ATP-binding protein
MNEGRVEQYGPPEEVFHHPATEFVMNFLGSVNLFHARLDGGREAAGPARVFVRPHELDIERSPSGAFAAPASVTRIQSTGPLVKVRLQTAEGEEINVELTHERYRELELKTGERVFVAVRGGRVFSGESAISVSPEELSQAARTGA